MATPFIGEIRIFAGTYAPEGWELCSGQLLNISGNEALFALIGTTYGGNGNSTFALPNLVGRLPVGQGQGTGLTNRTMGQSFGTDTVALVVGNLPVHRHVMQASSNPAGATTPNASCVLATTASSFYQPVASPPATTIKPLSALTIGSEGGNQPHKNHMPTLSLTYIIATTGIFPSQD